MKLLVFNHSDATSRITKAVAFWCSGCQEAHLITVEGKAPPIWGFDGNYEKPTFSPSVLVQGVEKLTEDQYNRVMAGEKIEPKPFVCHSFVRNGQIQYLTDCTHQFAGQIVDLEDMPEDWT